MKDKFAEGFLERYLQLGLGSMPKSDIDALVMHLLDKYGFGDHKPLLDKSNQDVSELLKTPISKVKRLRYEAALKYGDDVAAEAKERFRKALGAAVIEFKKDDNEISMILEDVLAKNWIQGQLKKNQVIFDTSFNTEIIKISSDQLLEILRTLFGKTKLKGFESDFKKLKRVEDIKVLKKDFKDLLSKIGESLVSSAVEGAVRASQ